VSCFRLSDDEPNCETALILEIERPRKTGPALIRQELMNLLNFALDRNHLTALTVADRYYSLASTNPMAAFSRVDDLGQKHRERLQFGQAGHRSGPPMRHRDLP
jgi:hypothetical protein